MIQPGWYQMYLNETQINYLLKNKIAELYPFRNNNKVNLNHDSYLVYAHSEWDPGIPFLKLSDNLYSISNISNVIYDKQVLHISEHTKPKLENIYSAGFLQTGNRYPSIENDRYRIPRPLHLIGLDGKGQVVTVADTGVDTNHCFFFDPNTPVTYGKINLKHRKIILYDNIADKYDPENGHGSHVCGIIAGKSFCSHCGISSFDGIAPGALLYMHDLGDLKKGSQDFGDVSLPFYVERMEYVNSHISSNSWGFAKQHENVRQAYSEAAYYHSDKIFIFACGNSGKPYTIFVPANSKNVLSIGSISTIYQPPKGNSYYLIVDNQKFKLNQVCGDSIYESIFLNPSIFIINMPIVFNKTEAINGTIFISNENIDISLINSSIIILKKQKNKKCPSNSSKLILYMENPININSTDPKGTIIPYLNENLSPLTKHGLSSQGPTELGYIKPEIVVPGSRITSARAQNPLKPIKATCSTAELSVKSGTSMAAPAAAGLIAIVRQYFVDKWFPYLTENTGVEVIPSSSLMKAFIINSANPFLDPLITGFGIPVLYEGLGFTGYGIRFINNISIGSNQHHLYNILITNNSMQLKITMSYLDPPLPSSTFLPLFADLDLVIVDPNGTVYHGNDLNDEFSTTEKVIIQNPSIGNYEIHVISSNYPLNTVALYSIVIHGGFNITDFNENPLFLNKTIPQNCNFKCKSGKCKNGICVCDSNSHGFNCNVPIDDVIIGKVYHIDVMPRIVYYKKFFPYDKNISVSFKCYNNQHNCIICFNFDLVPAKLTEPGNICYTHNESNEKIISFDDENLAKIKKGKPIHVSMYAITDQKSYIEFKVLGKVYDAYGDSINNYQRAIVILVLIIIVLIVIIIVFIFVMKRKINEFDENMVQVDHHNAEELIPIEIDEQKDGEEEDE